jgi:16S rRNA (uracil1498-N3)-methyltransferase
MRIVAYERERHTHIREALAGRPQCVALFVGPEGGFSAEEAALAEAADATLVSLGPRILRSETASPLLAGLVLYELGDF